MDIERGEDVRSDVSGEKGWTSSSNVHPFGEGESSGSEHEVSETDHIKVSV
jgi:hypothetical protein